MSARIRTGYSFRNAVGRIDSVLDRLEAIGSKVAPITDTASAFGWVKWNKACAKRGLRPVFGVEIAVTKSIHEPKKPIIDYWTFLPTDSLKPIHELIGLASEQFRYTPLLTVQQALAATDNGVQVIVGHRSDISEIAPKGGLYVGLGPSTTKGYINRAIARGHPLISLSDNRYPEDGGRASYEVICGRFASTQSYPQWILSDDEWRALTNLQGFDLDSALANRDKVFALATAMLGKGEIIHPDRPASLEAMCREGAKDLGCDLNDPVYEARMKRELKLIAEKEFEDYFYLVADVCQWARKKMIVGPARGSSCGSLVCYLLGITSIDPIPFGLIFERFIDINRSDLPDIDIDFSETRRELVFDYVRKKYGQDRVARLGTVAMFQPRSALKETAGALDIPPWKLQPVYDSIIQRSSGDSRALQATEDTLKDTAAGRAVLAEFPEIVIAATMEGHPRHAGQHAAGIVITQQPLTDVVTVDRRTGATHCDKKDAEDLNLLKIDALGLTQLSIFEDALELAGLPRDHLFSIPYDDDEAFKVLREKKYAGIFQFNGLALQSITDQIDVRELNDIVAITALARPGPLNTGGTNHWIKVKNGRLAETYPHPVFEPYLKENHGIVIYQEDIMRIGKDVGDLSWEDVTALRKAMSKSLGEEFFGQYRDKFVTGATSKHGIPEAISVKVFNDMSAFGSWAFNKCISGEEQVILYREYKGKKTISIKELYESGKKHTLMSLFPDGTVKKQKLTSVHYNGKRYCNKYTFSDGTCTICTPDHKFLIDGAWRPIRDAIEGSEFVSKSVFAARKERIPRKGNEQFLGIGYEGEGFPAGVSHPRWKGGTFKHGADFRNEKLANRSSCEDCSEIKPRMEVHHNDFNAGQTHPKDLVWLCPSCHAKRHRANGERVGVGERGFRTETKTLTKIEEIGIISTYDIEMPEHHNFTLENGLITHNSHAVAYGVISYWCCWLKAHYPLEFAAATLTHTDNPETQIKLLREMAAEGIEYVPADIDISIEKWTVGSKNGKKMLVGPLSNVHGVGPVLERSIISARLRGETISDRARKLLENPKTKIDSLFPIKDRLSKILPDPTKKNIFSSPVPIHKVQTNGEPYEVMVFCTLENIKPKDENEEINVAKRGYKFTGPTAALNLRLADDTDVVFAKVDRWDFEAIGKPMVERGRAGKALYAIKGIVPKDFRMIRVKGARYIGDLEKEE